MELTQEQKEIVNSNKDLLIVKGVAGSGKSLIAFHLANKFTKEPQQTSLFSNSSESDTKGKVLFLTYTNALVLDLREKYKIFFENENSNSIDFMTVNDFLWQCVSKIRKLPVNELVSKLKNIKDYKIEKYLEEVNRFKSYNVIERCDIPIKNNKYDFNFTFLKEEIEYIQANHIMNYEEYLKFSRVGRKKS